MPIRPVARPMHAPHFVEASPPPRRRAAEPIAPSAQPDQNESVRSGLNWTEDGDYLVGRGRPPVHTRWRPGQSGNPKGRSSEQSPSLDVPEIVTELMRKELRVNTSEGVEVSDHLRILLRKVYELAVKGNLGASRFLIGQLSEDQARKAPQAQTSDALSADEQTVLDTLLKAMGSAC